MLDKPKQTRIIFVLLAAGLLFVNLITVRQNALLKDEMKELGMPIPTWLDENYDITEIELGRKLIFEGSLGKGFNKVSPFFVCNDCHISVRQNKSLAVKNPLADQQFAQEKNIPYLPSGSFYGMINQEEFYSGDYDKKYGDLVIKAKNNIDEAIQLCAQECSQGRELSSVEVRVVKAYLSSVQLRVSDLFASTEESKAYDTFDDQEKIAWIKDKFSPVKSNTLKPTNLDDLRGLNGDAVRGKHLFTSACMSCHENERLSFYNIQDDVLSKQNLLKKLNNKDNELLTILRYGTQPIPGNKAYMPFFTAERLSNQQIADLISYLKLP